ncbi:hypothetical protein QBC44DRAFT_332980 [Cladorrhinum sp. PSN332]|nr:hypothetical protein QBC44DRAFT_332980 [Cladorrhinum sp. PSN332]
MVCLALTITSYYYMRLNYVGIDLADVPPDWDIKRGFFWTYVCQLLYNPVLGLIKSSILFFLLRLVPGRQNNTRVKAAIHALNAFNLAMLVAVFFAILLQCRPISWFWRSVCGFGIEVQPGEEEGSELKEGENPGTAAANSNDLLKGGGGGKCIDQVLLYLIQGGLNIWTDVLVLALPFWIFLGLKMPRRLKTVTLCVFGLGVVVPVVSVMRFVFLYLLFYSPIGDAPHYTMSFVLSAVETNLAIVCACAPAMWGLGRIWFPNFFVVAANNRTSGGEEAGMTSRTNQTWRYSTRRYGATRAVVEDGHVNGTTGPGTRGSGAPIGGTGSSHVEASALGLERGGGGGGRLGLTPSEEEIMINYGVVTKGEGGVVQVVGSEIGYRDANGTGYEGEIECVKEEVGNRPGRGGRIRQHSTSSFEVD